MFTSERAEKIAKGGISMLFAGGVCIGIAKVLDIVDRKANEQCDEDCCCESTEKVVDPTVGI